MMQFPTCENIRIRSVLDAHKIFYAVQRGTLKKVTRRLDTDERLALRSGCVYVWEERAPHTEITGLGIERFTEGKRWSPSRVRDEFLFYYEKCSPPDDPSEKLVKQTYTAKVETENGTRKWHLTAYFVQATVDQLGTIDNKPGVGDLSVPDGLFKSARNGKHRRSDETHARNSETPKTPSVNRTYAAFPTAYPPSSPQALPELQPPPVEQPPVYESLNSVNYGHHSPFYQGDSQLPQYVLTSSLPPGQYPRPAVRAYQPTLDPHRTSNSVPQNYVDYGRQDIYVRRPSLGYPTPRVEDCSFRSPSSTGLDHQHHQQLSPQNTSPTFTYQSDFPAPSYSTQHQKSTICLGVEHHHPSPKCGDQSLMEQQQRSPTWYPTSNENLSTRLRCSVSHSTSPVRPDLPKAYAIRPSYTAESTPSVDPCSPISYTQGFVYAPTHHSSLTSTYHRIDDTSSRVPIESLMSAEAAAAQMALPPTAPLLPDHSYDTSASTYDSSPLGEEDEGYDDSENKGRRESFRPCGRVDLAPLDVLTRSHPSPRDPIDDRALQSLLGPRSP